MSVTNERISNIMNTKLSPNGTGDLQVVFGVSVMNQEWYFTTAPINKWARYKPFRTPLGTSYNDHYSSSGSTRLAAARSANYGLSAPTTRSTPAATIGDSWVYNKCVSNQNAMRAQDFEGYYHAAGAPVKNIGDVNILLADFRDFDFGAFIPQNVGGGNSDQISWEDLSAIENYYLCVVLSTGANCTGTLYAKTASDTLGNGGVSLVITTMEQSQLRNAGYKYYYLVARSAKPSSGTWFTPSSGDASYMALPTENGTSDVMGSFTIYTSAQQSIEIDTVSQLASPSSASDFADASAYVGAGSSYLSYANKTQPYYMCLGLEIRSGSSDFTVTNAAIQLSQTFVSPGGYSARISCAIRNPSYQSVNSYTVPAGQTQTVYLIPSSPILSLNPAGRQQTGAATGQQFETGIQLYINGVMVDGTNFIRVSN